MILEGLLTRLCNYRDGYLAYGRENNMPLLERFTYIDGLEKAIEIVNDYSSVIEDKIDSPIKERENEHKMWTDSLVSKRSEIDGIKLSLEALMGIK
jgi:hypothetical protein